MLAIKSIRIPSIKLKRDDTGRMVIEYTQYQLISAKDTVLATQTIGEQYGQDKLDVPLSSETASALITFTEGYQKDIERVLGLSE